MRQTLKAVSLTFALAYYLLGAFLIFLFVPESFQRHKLLANWLHHVSSDVLFLMGVRYSIECHPLSQKHLNEGKNHLIVANHLSYIDVLLVASSIPTLFITSKEVESSLLGVFAKAGGCLFVERRSRAALDLENDTIAKFLEAGFNVVLFAEGTTSDGTQILPFKAALLESARRAGVDVLPVCLNYRSVNGMEVDSEAGDSVFFHGVMDFFPHLWRLLELEEIWAELVMLPSLEARIYPTRRMLADASYRLIRSRYISTVSANPSPRLHPQLEGLCVLSFRFFY